MENIKDIPITVSVNLTVEAPASNRRELLEKAANAIKELSFMPPVVTAKWVKRMEEKTMPGYTSLTPVWSCSACGRDYDPAITPTVHYCYNCGAKMEGGSDNGV